MVCFNPAPPTFTRAMRIHVQYSIFILGPKNCEHVHKRHSFRNSEWTSESSSFNYIQFQQFRTQTSAPFLHWFCEAPTVEQPVFQNLEVFIACPGRGVSRRKLSWTSFWRSHPLDLLDPRFGLLHSVGRMPQKWASQHKNVFEVSNNRQVIGRWGNQNWKTVCLAFTCHFAQLLREKCHWTTQKNSRGQNNA